MTREKFAPGVLYMVKGGGVGKARASTHPLPICDRRV
jgi:hypothetical protein